jgi:hypothetical protein
MFSMTFRQNLALRQTLMQNLGLESRFLDSCLIRSETLLRKLEYQRPLRLVRDFADEDDYRSVLDFLVAVFVPAMKARIDAFYDGHGQILMEQSGWIDIDRLDRMMVTALEEMKRLYGESRSAAWRRGDGEFTIPQLTAAWLDLEVRPRFTVPVIIDDAIHGESVAA